MWFKKLLKKKKKAFWKNKAIYLICELVVNWQTITLMRIHGVKMKLIHKTHV